MKIKSRLIAILSTIFVLTELINWIAIEGPIDDAFHLSFLEFLQPVVIFVVSLVSTLLLFVSPTRARKNLFIFVQLFIILAEIYILMWVAINASSLFAQIIDRFANVVVGLIFIARIYMIYQVVKLPDAEELGSL